MINDSEEHTVPILQRDDTTRVRDSLSLGLSFRDDSHEIRFGRVMSVFGTVGSGGQGQLGHGRTKHGTGTNFLHSIDESHRIDETHQREAHHG
jgi:hypothetical protein